MLFNLSAHAHDRAGGQAGGAATRSEIIKETSQTGRLMAEWVLGVVGLTTGILGAATTAAAAAATTIRTNDNNATMNCTRR